MLPLQAVSPSRSPRRFALPIPTLLLSLPSLIIQPASHPSHIPSLHASVIGLRRLLSLHTSGVAAHILPPEQECYAWMMLAEIGMRMLRLNNVESIPASSLPSWTPTAHEIETAISKSLRHTENIPTLRPLRHRLTLMHATLVHLQSNHKHARVLLKRLLPPSNLLDSLPKENAWSAYEAHLTIVDQILESSSSPAPTYSELQTALSHLSALAMLANQFGDYGVLQLVAVIRLTTLIQQYDTVGESTVCDIDEALADAERILGLQGLGEMPAKVEEQGKPQEVVRDRTATPAPPDDQSGFSVVGATPFIRDVLAGVGSNVAINLKTPAYALPTNPLAMDVFSSQKMQTEEQPEKPEGSEDLIPPYLRYLRVQTLMLGVLWCAQSGDSNQSAPRLSLLHEMMDWLSDLSKGGDWGARSGPGVLEVRFSTECLVTRLTSFIDPSCIESRTRFTNPSDSSTSVIPAYVYRVEYFKTGWCGKTTEA